MEKGPFFFFFKKNSFTSTKKEIRPTGDSSLIQELPRKDSPPLMTSQFWRKDGERRDRAKLPPNCRGTIYPALFESLILIHVTASFQSRVTFSWWSTTTSFLSSASWHRNPGHRETYTPLICSWPRNLSFNIFSFNGRKQFFLNRPPQGSMSSSSYRCGAAMAESI